MTRDKVFFLTLLFFCYEISTKFVNLRQVFAWPKRCRQFIEYKFWKYWQTVERKKGWFRSKDVKNDVFCCVPIKNNFAFD